MHTNPLHRSPPGARHQLFRPFGRGATSPRDSNGCSQRSARRCVRLGRVVSLDDFPSLEVRRSISSKPHHQHGTDGEVRHHQTRLVATPGLTELFETVRSEPRRAHPSRKPELVPCFQVVEDHIGMSRLDQNVGFNTQGVGHDNDT